MKILFTMKSYEITYKREIIRLVSLILIFLSLVFVGILWKSMPKIVNDFVFCILIYLPFMFVWSGLRLSQISDNKKHSIKMKKDDFCEIVQTYPASKFLILNDEKYVIYNPSIELQDEVILLRKDNKYFKKEDVKNLSKEKNANKFIELLNCNDEFCFIYNGVKYEIISEHGRSIYKSEGNILIASFKDNEELLKNAKLDGIKLSSIINKIIVI